MKATAPRALFAAPWLLGLLAWPTVSAAQSVLEVAVTVDDLPTHGAMLDGSNRLAIARQMLETFRAHRVPRPWGFVNARQLEDDPAHASILREWLAFGFPLGNHTFSHPDLNKTDLAAYLADIGENDRWLKKAGAGGGPLFFRYPYLHEGSVRSKRDGVRAHLKKNGYQIAQVTAYFGDWAWNEPYVRCMQNNDPEAVHRLEESYLEHADLQLAWARGAAKALWGRQIKHVLLLHVGEFNVRMLDPLLTRYERQGVRFIPLEQAVGDPAYRDVPRTVPEDESTFLEQVMKERRLDRSRKPGLPAELASACRP